MALGIMCVLGSQSVAAQGGDYSSSLASLAWLEEEGAGQELSGVKVAFVVYDDTHAPPLTGLIGLEYLSGDGDEVTRLSGGVSVLAIPGGRRYGLWVRPLLGLEYRDGSGRSGLEGFLGLGAEVIFRPHRRSQLALTFDRLFSSSGEASSQVGVVLRWGL